MRTGFTRIAWALLAIGLSVVSVGAQVIDTGAITAGGADCSTPTRCAAFTLPLPTPSVTLQVSGTYSGTLQFEATIDGTNWFSVTLTNLADGSTAASTTSTGQFSLSNSGVVGIRARCSSYTSGTAIVTAARGYASAHLLTPFFSRGLFGDGSAAAPSIAFASEPTIGLWLQGGNTIRFSQSIVDINGGWWELVPSAQTFTLYNGGSINWSSTNNVSGAVDLSLFRDAADTLAQRRGTNAQAFRIYNTFTDASNYERLNIGWASNVATIAPAAAGTGTARAVVVGQVTTVSALPTCNSAAKGAQAFVTDATATTFLSAVVGSGSNNVPVVCDGTSWKIG